MRQTIFRVASEESVIDREDILTAMRIYDQSYRLTENDCGRKYAIKYGGKLYPPKRILSLVINKPTSSFSGGKAKSSANKVFLDLDFEILNIETNVDTTSPNRAFTNDSSRINEPIPDVQDLMTKLFSQKWTNLHTNLLKLNDRQYAGVYVLAYSAKNLEGDQVKEQDIFYVGMTHAGIRKRLNQFIKGIEEDKHHSAARRFYKEYAGESPYSKLKDKKAFFVASVSIPCRVDKRIRTPLDLRKMGEVARLELYLIAHIKEKLQREPELNKK